MTLLPSTNQSSVSPPESSAEPTFLSAALLQRPWHDELRHLDRGLCAELVDTRLRVLARREAQARRVLGSIAGAFLHLHAHHRLGFVRLNDYARERLGLSARELQSVAKVAADLQRLPALAAAFERGQLSWTQARILGAVATPASEDAWLDAARGRTVRALEDLVRAASADGDTLMTAATSAARVGADDPDADTLDGEPTVRFRLLCPRGLRPLWRAAVELARRVAGEPLPVWRAAEAIAAEGLSGAAAPPEQQAAALQEQQDASASSAHDAAPPTTPAYLHSARSCQPAEANTVAAAVSALSARDAALLAASLPALPPLADDLDGLDAFALDARLRAAVAALHAVDWETGRLLRLLFDLRLYGMFGFPDTGSYVRERLGFSPRKARALVAVERATWHAPALAEAYQAGRISWFRALLVLPILRETTAAAWVARSAEVTARRLGDEVEWALTMQDLQPLCYPVAPPTCGTALDISSRQLRARAEQSSRDGTNAQGGQDPKDPQDRHVGIDAVLTFRAPASVAALLHGAIAAFTRPGELAWHGCERLLEHVCAEWERLPRHRDPIFARDGWRCAVPGCSSQRNLHDHHVVFRSRGGGNARDNRITMCAGHHLHGIHMGRIRAWGRAPEAIHWELGVRAGGTPLLTLEGDRYVSA